MLKMLIAIDGSDHARRAVEAVGRLLPQTHGIRALLLNVREGVAYYGELPPFDFEAVERVQRAAQDELLEAALTHARGCGLVEVSSATAVGQPAAEIVRLAQAEQVDQIVMGTHGKGALGSLFLGSVVQRVVHLAQVPVLLVK